MGLVVKHIHAFVVFLCLYSIDELDKITYTKIS